MDEDDDFWGISAALSTKESPSALGSWVGMVSKVEGRDKLLKFVQFAARFFKWRCLGVGDAAAAASWHGLFSSVQEGRKSVRVLKGINKINQAFDEVPNAATTYEKGLVAGMHFGLAMHWHFDYLAHCHRTKFIRFSDARSARVLFRPSGAIFPQYIRIPLSFVSSAQVQKDIPHARILLELGEHMSGSSRSSRLTVGSSPVG